MVHTRFHESYFWWVRGRDGNISCMSYLDPVQNSLKATASSTASTDQNRNNQFPTGRKPGEKPVPSRSLQSKDRKGHSKQVTITPPLEEWEVSPRQLVYTLLEKNGLSKAETRL